MMKPRKPRNEIQRVQALHNLSEPQNSTVDELTHLSNRKGFELLGKQIITRCNQFDKSLLLLYFDVHKIKFINDKYGREEGDKILKIFSQQLFKNFRHSDAVGCLGGDKFCVLCSGMFKEHLPNVLKRLHNRLLLAQPDWPIEFDMGVIPYNRAYHSINSLMEEADKKIYEHKRTNRVHKTAIEKRNKY